MPQRHPKFPKEYGPNMNYLIDMLRKTKSPIGYTDLRLTVMLHHNNTFLKYLKYCLEKKLIEKVYKQYLITQNGRILLNLLD